MFCLPRGDTTCHSGLKISQGFQINIYKLFCCQAPDGTQLEVPRPELIPGRSPKYQIHLKSETGQIFVLLINKEHNGDPVVVQVPPPPEIADALKREVGGDILSAAQSLSRGIKRERDSEDGGSYSQVEVKRGRFEGESEPGSEDHEASSDDRDTSLDREVAAAVAGALAPTQNITAEFSIPNIQTDIPGLEDILSSESKQFIIVTEAYFNLFFQCLDP